MFLSKYTTMSATATDEQIREIKRLFRKSMNGVVAASMREKGMAYRVNFGLTLPLIKRIASSITPNEILAERLWKEHVRESKMLATWLYPPQKMDMSTAKRWIDETPYTEIADVCCMNLFPYIDDAPQLATDCIASSTDMTRYIGYQLWYRLLSNGYILSTAELQNILSSCLSHIHEKAPKHTLSAALRSIKQAAAKCPQKLEEIIAFFSSVDASEENQPLIEDIIEECRYLKDR